MARDVHIGVRSEVGFSFFTPVSLVQGMLLFRTGGVTIPVTAPPLYVPLGGPAIGAFTSDITLTEWVAPRDIVFNSIWVHLSDALDAAESLSFRIVVDGTPSNAIALDMTTGDQVKGATGELMVAQDSLVTFAITAKSVNTESVISIGLGYAMARV